MHTFLCTPNFSITQARHGDEKQKMLNDLFNVLQKGIKRKTEQKRKRHAVHNSFVNKKLYVRQQSGRDIAVGEKWRGHQQKITSVVNNDRLELKC